MISVDTLKGPIDLVTFIESWVIPMKDNRHFE